MAEAIAALGVGGAQHAAALAGARAAAAAAAGEVLGDDAEAESERLGGTDALRRLGEPTGGSLALAGG